MTMVLFLSLVFLCRSHLPLHTHAHFSHLRFASLYFSLFFFRFVYRFSVLSVVWCWMLLLYVQRVTCFIPRDIYSPNAICFCGSEKRVPIQKIYPKFKPNLIVYIQFYLRHYRVISKQNQANRSNHISERKESKMSIKIVYQITT